MGRNYDVFGDGTVLLVHTPGHSQELFAVTIKAKCVGVFVNHDPTVEEQLIELLL